MFLSAFVLLFAIILFSVWGWDMRRLRAVAFFLGALYSAVGWAVVQAEGEFITPTISSDVALDVLIQGVHTLALEMHRAIALLGALVLLLAVVISMQAFVLRRGGGRDGGD